jgi:hypothetical protein
MRSIFGKLKNIKSETILGVTQLIILVFGIFLTITQIKDLRNVNAGQIVLDINRDIYSNERYQSNPKIIRLIEQGKPILNKNGGHFVDQDLDNLLGEWDTVARLNQSNVLPDDIVYSQFSFDMVRAYDNIEISDYIKLTRKQANDPLIFSDYENLAKWMKLTAGNKY